MSQIMISLRMIRENSPCASGWRKVREANKHRDIDDMFPMSSILESNGLEDTLWALRCLPIESQLWRRFSWWCASSVVRLSSDRYTQDILDTVDRYIKGEATNAQLIMAYRDSRSTMDAAVPRIDTAHRASRSIDVATASKSATDYRDSRSTRDATDSKLVAAYRASRSASYSARYASRYMTESCNSAAASDTAGYASHASSFANYADSYDCNALDAISSADYANRFSRYDSSDDRSAQIEALRQLLDHGTYPAF